MDKAALVSVDIETGSEIVDILDGAGLKVSVAAWVCLSEYGDWRLVLSGRSFDGLGLRDAYGLLHKTLATGGFPYEKTPTVLIFPMTDPFIRDLRKAFAKTRNGEGARLGGRLFGDRFVEDGYAYRIS